jgi:uncharacterized membrane protein
VAGEICGNWLALSLASAAVVTPMGIMSVVVNAVLAQRFLGEVVGREKRRGYYAIMVRPLIRAKREDLGFANAMPFRATARRNA